MVLLLISCRGVAVWIVEGESAKTDYEMRLGAILDQRRLADSYSTDFGLWEGEVARSRRQGAESVCDEVRDLLGVDITDDRDRRAIGAYEPPRMACEVFGR